jgi:hypothetical protein
MIKRILYLGYYIKQMDWEKFSLFLGSTAKITNRKKITIWVDILFSVFKYNISILEYFQFRFFEKNNKVRNQWAGTGFMYEYQLIMNPKKTRQILDDKTLFYKEYGIYFVHVVADICDLKKSTWIIEKLLNTKSGRLVFKVSDGKCGVAIQIKMANEFDGNSLIAFMENNNFDLVEEFIIQHRTLNQLSSTAVNTVRIFTQLNVNNEVDILGCRLRISVNSHVDNMAAGNLAAPIDRTTGRIYTPAVYSDFTKREESTHPLTNVSIVGFEVPYWEETIQMVKAAALLHPQNRSIGWDIVITDDGPGLIEGNHDWCKLLWQLPVNKGLKHLIKPNCV